mgnify:CR=1 FL=1
MFRFPCRRETAGCQRWIEYQADRFPCAGMLPILVMRLATCFLYQYQLIPRLLSVQDKLQSAVRPVDPSTKPWMWLYFLFVLCNRLGSAIAAVVAICHFAALVSITLFSVQESKVLFHLCLGNCWPKHSWRPSYCVLIPCDRISLHSYNQYKIAVVSLSGTQCIQTYICTYVRHVYTGCSLLFYSNVLRQAE